jgi:hypothetical protein
MKILEIYLNTKVIYFLIEIKKKWILYLLINVNYLEVILIDDIDIKI